MFGRDFERRCWSWCWPVQKKGYLFGIAPLSNLYPICISKSGSSSWHKDTSIYFLNVLGHKLNFLIIVSCSPCFVFFEKLCKWMCIPFKVQWSLCPPHLMKCSAIYYSNIHLCVETNLSTLVAFGKMLLMELTQRPNALNNLFSFFLIFSEVEKNVLHWV